MSDPTAPGRPAPAGVVRGLLADLAAESADLQHRLDPLRPEQWRLPTPAVGWTVADQVSHLAWFDDAARKAALHPDDFRRETAELGPAGLDLPDRIAAEHRHLGPEQLLAWFGSSRRALLETYAGLDPATRLPWYGPDMGVASALTARLMETWAHGQDVADALGVQRSPTDRIRHVAELGVRTRGFSFLLHGRPVPDAPVRVELYGPGGDLWTWGPPDAVDRVTGPALDFCLVVTQRRPLDGTALVGAGPVATAWLAVAQAFAGPPGRGRGAPGGPVS